jgi:hypothetical protein
VHSIFVHTYGLSTNDKKDGFLRLIIITIVKITSTDKEIVLVRKLVISSSLGRAKIDSCKLLFHL